MTKRKYVDVTVSWCDGVCSATAKVPLSEWDDVLDGERVNVNTKYWYDGKKFEACFQFNATGRGSLVVTYGGEGGEGFIGSIDEADIVGGNYPAL